MFVYLSKKIAIPNNAKINCLSWNRDQGYIAVGGEEGLLKVLKLEQATSMTSQAKGGFLAAPSNLSMNQTLEGHKAAVQVVVWNESQQKLTTSDRDGVIMVWMLYKGSWYEEMTNDRKKSTVTGMAWTSDGQKICIVYEDGAIIVGSVDGNRIWGKDLKNTLHAVQWSPDDRLLVFSLKSGDCHLYDSQGAFIMKLNIQCVSLSQSKQLTVIGLAWFNGKSSKNRVLLAICYENGKMQLMKNEYDDNPIVIDTQLTAIGLKWNHDGSILAVCGTSNSLSEKDSNHVVFYSPLGNHLRTLKIPGKEITALSWEGKSLRVAIAVDSFIYFANIRPDYIYCYFGKTLAFLESELKNDQYVITFWDTTSNQCNLKYIESPLGMAAWGNHAVIANEIHPIVDKDVNAVYESNSKDPLYQLMICSSIGTTIDAKYVDIRPIHLTINTTNVIIASKEHIVLWQFNTSKSNVHNMKSRKDKKFHVDDTPSGVAEVLSDLDKHGYKMPINTGPTQDPICCITASDKLLLVGRESGVIQEYTIANIVLCNRHTLANRANKMAINCNSTRAAVIDSIGALHTINLTDSVASENLGRIDRKDVWAICWAKDNPQLLAIMEKTRMYIIRGNDPEEPISCSGYITNFEDLEITCVLLDEIIGNSSAPNTSDHLLQLRVKSLRDTEDLLTHVGIVETKQFIEDNPHPRLWRLLAEASLKKLDMETAETSFVRCTNYPGLQLIKKLRNIQNERIQKAEIAAFYGDYDEAEKLYIDADRRDLAISLRVSLQDWFRTITLYRMGPGISDQQMEQAWKEIGDHFANLSAWESAKEYYEKAHYMDGLIDTLYHLEQYDELDECVAKLSDKNPLLAKLGQMLASIGMCSQAVTAYLKLGDVKSAVNTAVSLKQWAQAVELAQKYKMPQINTLLTKHAAQLLQEGRLPEAVELQKKAGRFLDSARLLIKLAEGEIAKKSELLRIKQIYVLAGQLVEEYLQTQMSLTGINRTTMLGQLPSEDMVLIDSIWHNAEAYHFFILCQRQLRSGLLHSAAVTAIRLREYENVLNEEEIYCLLALSGIADRSFGTVSKAFIKLESLEGNITEKKRLEYEELAISIFSKFEPRDSTATVSNLKLCTTCESQVADWSTSCVNCGTHFPVCIATGQPIMNPQEVWQCTNCYRIGHSFEIAKRNTCPLCHTTVKVTHE